MHFLAGIVVCALAVGCHHAAPAKPEPPPETPIGVLVDASLELALTDHQRDTLLGIDAELVTQLQKPGVPHRPPPRRQHRRGGLGGTGMAGPNGGMGGRGGGGPVRHGPPPAPPAKRTPVDPSIAMRDAIVRAFGVLDDAQRERARSVLARHDIDPALCATPTDH